MTNYEEVTIVCSDELIEIISAELQNIGFEGFWQSDNSLVGYIESEKFNAQDLQEVLSRYNLQTSYRKKPLENKNWNELWESNYQSILIGNSVYVRAPFHEEMPGITHDIVIQPKMSFGTGHHETTMMMISNMLDLDLDGKVVLDMGCGTGVLGILAGKKGAARVIAVDNDDWAYQNSVENFTNNNISDFEVIMGEIESVPGLEYDAILSNITRNSNIAMLPEYRKILKPGGYLLLSGFLEYDLPDVVGEAERLGFHLIKTEEKNHWTAIILKKE